MRFGPPSPLCSSLLLMGAGPSGGTPVQRPEPPDHFTFGGYSEGQLYPVRLEFAWLASPSEGVTHYLLRYWDAGLGEIDVITVSAGDPLEAFVETFWGGVEWTASLVAVDADGNESEPLIHMGVTPEPEPGY